MADRRMMMKDFLERSGWGNARLDDLAGDASNRRYFRVNKANDHAVLMDAPPEKGEDVGPFVQIAKVLRAVPLSAPRIMAEDRDAGFLLLEDLGDDLFAVVLAKDPAQEEELYTAATDALIKLHDIKPPPGLAPYDAPTMTDLASLAFDWYANGITGEDHAGPKASFLATFSAELAQIKNLTEVLIQRDYHAENLLWLPKRDGVARVGLLDFQDAMSGHRSYDLVSLLQDARRDVSPQIEAQMIEHYIAATGCDPRSFRQTYALMGLQRNLRIIGVFARLCMRDGKPHYIDLIPRVWAHMRRDFEMANLQALEPVLMNTLPPPNNQALEGLKAKCGMIPQPS